MIRQWMCHTFLRAIFYKQYAIFKDQIEYNNNSTSVFQWTLHFSSRHIVNLLSDKKKYFKYRNSTKWSKSLNFVYRGNKKFCFNNNMLQPVTAIQKSVSTCLKIYRHCTSSLRTMPLHTRQLYPSRNWPSRIWCSWSSATQSRSCFYGPRHIFSYQITVKRVKFEDSDKLKYATCTTVSRIDSNWYSSVLNSWLMKCEE